MKKYIAQALQEILEEGNFKSNIKEDFIVNNKQRTALILNHDEVSSKLALQHIQEFIDNDINFNDSEWLSEYNLDNVFSLNIKYKENECFVF